VCKILKKHAFETFSLSAEPTPETFAPPSSVPALGADHTSFSMEGDWQNIAVQSNESNFPTQFVGYYSYNGPDCWFYPSQAVYQGI
jgi:hypothetical protein